jgi:peptidoglycan/LPS O-acetylase OafA/YrhL
MFVAFLLLALVGRSPEPAPGGGGSAFLMRFLSFYGYISYGLYLVHQFVWDSYDRVLGVDGAQMTFGSLSVRFLAGMALSTGIAYLSRRYFEDYFLRQKNRFMKGRG